MGMSRRHACAKVAVLAAWFLASGALSTRAQSVVVTARSAGQLADSLAYLLQSASPPNTNDAQEAMKLLRRFKAGEILPGMDQTRLLGLAATLPRKPDEGSPWVVAAVPVTDYTRLIDGFKTLNLKVDDNAGVPGYSHKITTANGQYSAYALESNRYALLSLIPTSVATIRDLDPESWRSKAEAQPDLLVKLRLSELPEATKELFLKKFSESLAQKSDRRPNEPETEYKSRMVTTRLGQQAMESLIREGDTIEMALRIDRARDSASLSLLASALPNTAMAANLQSFESRRSRFSWIGEGAAMAGWMSVPVPAGFRDMFGELLEQHRKEQAAKPKSNDENALNERFDNFLKRNLTSGEIDLGLAFQGPHKNSSGEEHFAMTGGMALLDGPQLERMLRDAAVMFPSEKGTKIKFDVFKGPDGISIHRIDIPESSLPPDLIKKLGSSLFFIAFPANGVVFSCGEGSKPALDAALANLGQVKTGPSDPVAIQTHLSALGQFADAHPDALRPIAAEIFRGSRAGRDAVSLGARSDGQRLRLEFSMDIAALQFAAMAGKISKPRAHGGR
jgi:hypothetical protein